MIVETEEWRDIPGYEGFYRVSSLGRVLSLGRVVGGRRIHEHLVAQVLVKQKGRCYPRVGLYKEGSVKITTVHSLVAEYFVQKISGVSEVKHKDGDNLNNRADKLYFSTRKRNQVGERNSDAKLCTADVLRIRHLVRIGWHKTAIAKHMGVCRQTIYDIYIKRSWSHVPDEAST